MSRLLATMLAAIAEFERDLIRERTRLGVAKARQRGWRLGHRDRSKCLPKGSGFPRVLAVLGLLSSVEDTMAALQGVGDARTR